ncbi:MAG TPA: malonic semialdehyde reductase [Bryobacteraceae bacterium]|jgi:3-hydroxypropanoate dehydrogenase|nr:malonic semialdehyde reductase [Bryobacteraceae bacterium]
MNTPLSNDALDVLFRKARTHNAWLDKPVSDDLLHQLYELVKYGPTSANSCPARILFVRTPEAKQRLLPALSPTNVDKTMKAPVTAILGYDVRFFEQTPKLFPHNPGMANVFSGSAQLAETTAFRNGSLQGAYMILAARALGLDCGAMSGFDNAKVDAEFFTSAAGNPPTFVQVKSNFLCNLGYGDDPKLPPRNPRLAFEEACRLL